MTWLEHLVSNLKRFLSRIFNLYKSIEHTEWTFLNLEFLKIIWTTTMDFYLSNKQSSWIESMILISDWKQNLHINVP